jgi:transposase
LVNLFDNKNQKSKTTMRTNKFKKLTTKTLISAVDFSKSKHTGYFTTITREEAEPFNFANNREGFEKYWRRLQKFKEKHNLEDVVVSFESTGSYGVPFIHFLKSKGVKMLQVNPKHTKRTKEVTDNSPNKTDKKDPRVIANLILFGSGLTVNVANGKIQALRNYIYNREAILEDQTRLINRLESLLAVNFPEYLEFFSNITCKTSLYILRHYPLPEDLLKFNPDELTEKLKKISRGRVGINRTRELIEKADRSVGVCEDQTSFRETLAYFLDQLELIRYQRKQIELKIDQVLEEIPSSKILLTVKGLSRVSVAAILSEIIDFKNFDTIREVNKYTGFNLFEISSGKYQGRRRIAKRGRALLRKALFFATLNMVKKDGIFHEDYQRHIEKGMPRMKALIAISRKLLRMIFAMVRDEETFDINRLKQAQQVKQAA